MVGGFNKNEKIRKLKALGIRMDDEMERRIDHMCNMGSSIAQKNIEKGIAIGTEKGIAIGKAKELYDLFSAGLLSKEIALQRAGISEEEFFKIGSTQ